MTKEEIDAQITMVGDNAQIKLKNVRLRFGDLFTVREQEGQDKKGNPVPRYTLEGTFLLNEETQDDQIALVKRAIQRVITAKFGGKKVVVAAANRCLQSGMMVDPDTDEKVERYAFCEGNMLLSARAYLRSATAENPIQLLGPRKTMVRGKKQWVQLTEENGGRDLLYLGCYCNIVVRLWATLGDPEKNMPNRVSASLEIVQHCGRGEEIISGNRADADELMDEEEVDEDEADLDGTEGLDDDLGAAGSSGGAYDDFE